jgi:TonB family protein
LLAAAEEYEFVTRNQGTALILEKGAANYPGNRVRSGQEGWVRASFVVDQDGRAIDTIIMDSSGGVAFEQSLIEMLEDTSFEAPDAELPNNTVDFRHEIRRGRDAATSNFIRRTKRIMTHLLNDEIEPARVQIDETYKLGGWNLYESTMLWLMMGRVEGAEGDQAGKLEMYQRALRMGNSRALPREDRIELLEKIFLLQMYFDQYSAALRSATTIENTRDNEASLERIRPRVEEIEGLLADAKAIRASATIINPCNCDEGTPLWSYVPARRIFSFEETSGNVERFEARCEGQRISGAVESDKRFVEHRAKGNPRRPDYLLQRKEPTSLPPQ